jgi:hypothetical protein
MDSAKEYAGQAREYASDFAGKARDYAGDLAGKAREYVGGMTHGSAHREGGLAKPIEEVTAALPSDVWLWLGYGSIAASLTLRLMGRAKDANFVGMWVPVFLIHGVYNKLVKQLGHDKYDRDRD